MSALLGHDSHHMAQEHARIGAAPALVGVGKMQPYVAHGGRAQNGVGKCMEGHVGVAVPEQAELEGYLNAAYHASPPLNEAVNIEAVADTEVHDDNGISGDGPEGREDRPYRMSG